MDGNYTKLGNTISTSEDNQSDSRYEINVTQLEKDSFEPIEYEDVKNEPAIFEAFKAKEYTDIVSGVLKSIDNYYKDTDTYDDYPYFRVQNTCKFIPSLSQKSEILSERQLRELHAHLPYYHQYKNFKLVYKPNRDGWNMRTFYDRIEGSKNSILVVKDDSGNVFGAFVSEEYQHLHKKEFYGTGETFIFTFFKSERIHCFPSTGLNDYYIFSDYSTLSFGCSGEYFSLSFENDFLKGYSRTTETFKNPNLTGSDNFFVKNLELWTFEGS